MVATPVLKPSSATTVFARPAVEERAAIPRFGRYRVRLQRKKAPTDKRGLLRVGALSRASSFLIGNWRWSTWGPFRESSQGLVLATGCLFFALRPIAGECQACSSRLVPKMVDWNKYRVLRARVPLDLEAAVITAADERGETVPSYLRRVLVESTGLNIETDQKETSAA